jgi:hypothetical protein
VPAPPIVYDIPKIANRLRILMILTLVRIVINLSKIIMEICLFDNLKLFTIIAYFAKDLGLLILNVFALKSFFVRKKLL